MKKNKNKFNTDDEEEKASLRKKHSSDSLLASILKDTPLPNTQGLLEGLHPEDVKILLDAFTNFKYGVNSNNQSSTCGLDQANIIDHNWIARDRGFEFEFNENIKYPRRKPGLRGGYIIFEYPKSVATEGNERIAFVEAKLQEFESINIALKNENQRQLMYAWTEDDWIKIAKEYDPYKRDTKRLEENLKKRKAEREEEYPVKEK